MFLILDTNILLVILQIDEDDILLSGLERLRIAIPRKVYEECEELAFGRLKRRLLESKSEKDIVAFIQRITAYIKDISMLESFENGVKGLSDYKHRNGEYFSTLLAYELNATSREFIYFMTDDAPATKNFNDFFSNDRMGWIGNAIDLLVILFRHDNRIDYRMLERVFSSYRSLYSKPYLDFERAIKGYQMPSVDPVNLVERKYVQMIEEAIREKDDPLIAKFIEEILRKPRQFPLLNRIVKEFVEASVESVQPLSVISEIDITLDRIRRGSCYRWIA